MGQRYESGDWSGSGASTALESLPATAVLGEMNRAREAELLADRACCTLVVAELDGRLREWMRDQGVVPRGAWGGEAPELSDLLSHLDYPWSRRRQIQRVVALIRERRELDAALGARFRELVVDGDSPLGRPGHAIPLSKVELIGRLVPRSATVRVFDGIRDAVADLSTAQLRDVIARLLPPRKRMKKAPSLASVRGAIEEVMAARAQASDGRQPAKDEVDVHGHTPHGDVDVRCEDRDLRRRQQRVLRGRLGEAVYTSLLDALTEVATAHAPPPVDPGFLAELDHAEALRIALVSMLTRLHPSRAGTGSFESTLYGWDPEHPPIGSPDALIRVRCTDCTSTHPIPWDDVLAGRVTQERLLRGEIPEIVRLMLLLEGEGQCAAPGCRNRAAHGHHIHPQRSGKNHHPSNIVFLCIRHHLSIVERGTLRLFPGPEDDQLEWVYPDGQVVVTRRRMLPAFAGRSGCASDDGESDACACAGSEEQEIEPSEPEPAASESSAGQRIAATVRSRSRVLREARQRTLELRVLLASHLRERDRQRAVERRREWERDVAEWEARDEEACAREALRLAIEGGCTWLPTEPLPWTPAATAEHEVRPELNELEENFARMLHGAKPRPASPRGVPIDRRESLAYCKPAPAPSFAPLLDARRAFTRYGECASELTSKEREERGDGVAELGYTDIASLAEDRHQLSRPELSERRRVADAVERFPSCGELFHEFKGGLGKKKMLTLGRSELELEHDSILAAVGPHVTDRSFGRVVDSIEGKDYPESRIEWELPLPAETHSMFRRFARLVGRVLGCSPSSERVIAYLVRSLRAGKWVDENGRPPVAVTLASMHSMEVRHGPPRHAAATYQCDCCEKLWQHDEDGQVLYPTLERQQEVLLFGERVRWLPREVDTDPDAFDTPQPHPAREREALDAARGCSVPGCPCAAWDPTYEGDRHAFGPAPGLLRALPLATLRAAAEAARHGNVAQAAPDPDSRSRPAEELIPICAAHLWQIVSGLMEPVLEEGPPAGWPGTESGGAGAAGSEPAKLADRVRWQGVDVRLEGPHQRSYLPRQQLGAWRVDVVPVDLESLLERCRGREPPG